MTGTRARCPFTLFGINSGAGRSQQLCVGRNYYALEVTTRLGLEGSGGMVRVGPVHYNTLEEIQRFGEALGRIATGVH